mmetsp:Transcript_8727/g.16012  ORF Transcript_8727/g.16012 Transcript_8727/m.16012 type:complete len:111 (+) Transcript_8727:2247-2579(+)
MASSASVFTGSPEITVEALLSDRPLRGDFIMRSSAISDVRVDNAACNGTETSAGLVGLVATCGLLIDGDFVGLTGSPVAYALPSDFGDVAADDNLIIGTCCMASAAIGDL